MEDRSHALIAGLFALLLGIAAVAALWWFGGQQEASREYLVLTQKNVTGLTPQAQVRYRGVRVGRVEAIDLDPHDVGTTLIRIGIKKSIPITRGTTAKLGYQGVTGIAHVQLDDSGKDKALLSAGDGGLPRIVMQDSLLQELSDAGGDTLRNARDFLANANALLSPENRQSIARTLAGLETATGNANALLSPANRQSMARTLANLETTTGNAKEATAQLRALLTPENIRLLNSTLTRAEQTVGQAGPFFAEARGLVAHLQAVSEKLEIVLGDTSSGGSAALVPRLNELSSELATSSRQLNRVLQMLEQSPQSLIFGPRRATPGPGEPGFSAPSGGRGSP